MEFTGACYCMCGIIQGQGCGKCVVWNGGSVWHGMNTGHGTVWGHSV